MNGETKSTYVNERRKMIEAKIAKSMSYAVKVSLEGINVDEEASPFVIEDVRNHAKFKTKERQLLETLEILKRRIMFQINAYAREAMFRAFLGVITCLVAANLIMPDNFDPSIVNVFEAIILTTVCLICFVISLKDVQIIKAYKKDSGSINNLIASIKNANDDMQVAMAISKFMDVFNCAYVGGKTIELFNWLMTYAVISESMCELMGKDKIVFLCKLDLDLMNCSEVFCMEDGVTNEKNPVLMIRCHIVNEDREDIFFETKETEIILHMPQNRIIQNATTF